MICLRIKFGTGFQRVFEQLKWWNEQLPIIRPMENIINHGATELISDIQNYPEEISSTQTSPSITDI